MEEDYVVRRGDSLSKIAASHGMSLDRLIELNRGLLPDPDNINDIKEGQKIRLSGAPRRSLLDMLPSMNGSGSSYDTALAALKELAGNAGEYLSESPIGDNLRKVNWFMRAMPQIAPAAIRYTHTADNTVVEDQLPRGARQALAFLVANHGDELRRKGIQNYGLYQKYGGATDMAGMTETPTNIPMDVLAKILGDISNKGFVFNEDGSATVTDRYNVNLHTDFAEGEMARRFARNPENLTGAYMGGAEYLIQKARNTVAAHRDDMHDYKLPPVNGSVHPSEREIVGYDNVINLSREEIEAARNAFSEPDAAQRQRQALLGLLSTAVAPINPLLPSLLF